MDAGFLHDGETPLHAYVRRHDKQKLQCLMTFLVHAEYDVDMVNKDGDSALHLACKVSLFRCYIHPTGGGVVVLIKLTCK